MCNARGIMWAHCLAVSTCWAFIAFCFSSTVCWSFPACGQYRSSALETTNQLSLGFQFFWTPYSKGWASLSTCNRQWVVRSFCPSALWWISLSRGCNRMFSPRSWTFSAPTEFFIALWGTGFRFYLASAWILGFWCCCCLCWMLRLRTTCFWGSFRGRASIRIEKFHLFRRWDRVSCTEN